MKKNIPLTTLMIIISFSFNQVYSQANYSTGCIASDPNNTSALGFETQGIGLNSFAAGYKSKALGLNSSAIGENCAAVSQSYAIGQNAKATADNSFAFGRFVETSGNGPGSMVIGCSNTASGILINNKSNSLMIGFTSTPVFFADATKVGIATSSPLFTFDVNGTSFFRNEVRMATLRSPKGKRVVVTDEEGKLSFAEDFLEIPGDNLGNHIATQNIYLSDHTLSYGNLNVTKPGDVTWYPGLRFNSDNSMTLSTGKEAYLTVCSGSDMKSGIWATNWSSGGYGLVLNADNQTGGIYYDFNDPKETMNFRADKVGIGYTPPATSTYKLFVTGGILTEEVLVKLQSEWADYVFEPDYQLQDLDEVEKYITVNKHLPGVPSKADVKENVKRMVLN